MDDYFHTTLYAGCNYLSIFELDVSPVPLGVVYQEIVNVVSEEEVCRHDSQKVKGEVFFPHFRHPVGNSQAKDGGLDNCEGLGIQSI